MTFLNPIPAIIASAIAVPLLLALYFLKLRRQTKDIPTTMFWEKSVRDLHANTPFQRLRPSWLLLLQLLILLLFLAALARPTLGIKTNQPAKVILLIDSSASMSAQVETNEEINKKSSPTTRFDLAKQAAIDYLNRLDSSSTQTPVMLMILNKEARITQSFTSDMKLLRSVIQSLQPTDETANLKPALKLVEAYLSENSEDITNGSIKPNENNTKIILISDGRFNDQPPYQLKGQADFQYIKIPQTKNNNATENTNATPDNQPKTKSDPYQNIGIVRFSARRDYEDPATVRILCSLLNSGRKTVRVPVILDFNEKQVAIQLIEVPGSSHNQPSDITDNTNNSPPDHNSDKPGEAEVLFRFTTTQSGYLRASIDSQDHLLSDNVAGMMLKQPTQSSVLLVYPQKKSVDSYLLNILEILDLRSIQQMDSATFAELGKLPQNERAARLASYELIIFDRVTPDFTPIVPTLSFHSSLPIKDWFLYQAGRTPINKPDTKNSPTNNTPTDNKPAKDNPISRKVLSWNRTHAIMSDVNLDNLVVADPTRIHLPNNRGTVLALASGGPIITLLEQNGIRRVIVSFDLIDSNWPILPSMAIFMKNTVEYLTMRGQIEAGISYQPGQPVEIPAPPALLQPGSETTLQITGSNFDEQFSINAQQQITGSKGQPIIIIPPFTQAGLYTIHNNTNHKNRVVVNVTSRTESNLLPVNTITIGTQKSQGKQIAEALPREIWRWLATAALILLVLEWWLYTLRARQ